MAQLGIVDEILQKFRNIDEFWRAKKNKSKENAIKPFALVSAEKTLEESEVKMELFESEAYNSGDNFDQENADENKESLKFIELHIEKVESLVPEISSIYYCYICERSKWHLRMSCANIFHLNHHIQVSQMLQASTDIVHLIINRQVLLIAIIVIWNLPKRKLSSSIWLLTRNSGVSIAPNYSKIRECTSRTRRKR